VELTIAGYEDFELVAEGSMGSIYRCQEIATGKELAYKMMNPMHSGDKWVQDCLKTEFDVAKKFDCPNLVRSYKWKKNSHAFFMDFVEGQELKSVFGNALINFKARQTIALGICDALSYMHTKLSRCYLHLDIKPENVMIRKIGPQEILKRSDIVLIDYGTIQEVIRGPKILSFKGLKDLLSDEKIIGGSYLYMSPEQSRVEDLDVTSDIYSLGCLMYEMFSGKLPFVSKFVAARQSTATSEDETMVDRQELKIMHCKQVPMDPREHNARIPAALSDLIMRCLKKKPSKRFKSVQELTLAIQRIQV
jgi:serine/threonine protein kinase